MASAGKGEVLRDVLIVDISRYEERKHEIAQQLHHAAAHVGFFYVKVCAGRIMRYMRYAPPTDCTSGSIFLDWQGHGISSVEVEKLYAAGDRFLALPTEVRALRIGAQLRRPKECSIRSPGHTAQVKEQYKWISDRYLGWRSQSDLESVTGTAVQV